MRELNLIKIKPLCFYFLLRSFTSKFSLNLIKEHWPPENICRPNLSIYLDCLRHLMALSYTTIFVKSDSLALKRMGTVKNGQTLR